MERAFFAAYPTVTVINVADVLDRIESVVDQITFVVRFLAGFSILAGSMILASSIASARFRRMHEAVVLKTLGATRMRIVRTFSVEFSVLGSVGGISGCGVRQSADASSATQARGRLPYRLGCDGLSRWLERQFWPRDRLDRELSAFSDCAPT